MFFGRKIKGPCVPIPKTAINSAKEGKTKVSAADIQAIKSLFQVFLFEIMGIQVEKASENQEGISEELIQLIIDLRNKAKAEKNYALSDELRQGLQKMKITLKDTPAGTEWIIA